jgi:hypothetical protein
MCLNDWLSCTMSRLINAHCQTKLVFSSCYLVNLKVALGNMNTIWERSIVDYYIVVSESLCPCD